MRRRSLTAGLVTVIMMLAATVTTTTAVDAAAPHCLYGKQVRMSTGGYGDIPVRSRTDGSPACLLTYGDRTIGVAVLQKTLNNCYGARLAEDGIYGKRTMAAVMSAQRASGAKVDGVYGPETAYRINHWAGSNRTCGRM